MDTAKKGYLTTLFEKIKEKKIITKGLQIVHSLFLLPQLQGTKTFFGFGGKKPLQRLGFVLKGALPFKLRTDLGYARDLYKMGSWF